MSGSDYLKTTSPCKVSAADVLHVLHQPGYTPMNQGEIAVALKLRGKGRKMIAKVLHRMVMDGQIVVIRTNRYSLGEPADLATGRLEISRSGDGFLVTEKGRSDVVIPKANMGTALPGDQVTVRLEPRAPGRGTASAAAFRPGKVIRVLERGKRVIVGTLKTTERFYYVVPLDPAYDHDFYVSDPGRAKVDDRVVIQFSAWENRHVNPEAEIIDVIGPAENPSLDTIATLRHYGLPESFPPEVLRDVEEAAARMDRPGERLDLRDPFIITIDPATAKDFDDALSLRFDPEGRRVLGVHIADVSHFVPRGSPTDREAQSRGNSVYLPDKVIPMLPEQLSNGLCSLKPGQDRLTFSVFITFDAHANPVGAEFARSVIRSGLRLTYEQAMAALSAEGDALPPESPVSPDALVLLRRLNELAQQLRQRRFAQHALNIDMPECDVVLGPDGMISDVRVVPNDISHQLVEECMVAANEAVDHHLSDRGLQILHRVHEPPSPERIADLTAALARLGYTPGDLRQRKQLAGFLAATRSDPMAHHIHSAVLRSLKRAVYSPLPKGHFGLAKRYYAHFTSPIRRYPDLVVHRILATALAGGANPYAAEDLAVLGTHCSWTEQVADEAERFLVEIKKYRFLEQQLADGKLVVYDAVAVNVRNFGMFVELIDLQVQGLVHVSAISSEFVHFDSVREVLRAGNRTYQVGTPVRVRVSRVDFDKRRIDFALAERADRPGEARRPEPRPAPAPSVHRSRHGADRRRTAGSKRRSGPRG